MTHDIEFIDTITVTTDRKDKIYARFDKWLSSLKEIAGTPKTETRTFSLEYKRQLWESNPSCSICGQKIHVADDAEVDHIEQFWRGGKTIPVNARLTHRYCNRARSPYNEIPKEGEVPQRKGPKTTRVRGAIPQKEYFLPILEALTEKGGSATQKEAFEIIERKLSDKFNELDVGILNDGTVRWQKNTAFQKFRMVKTGFLRSDSPRGTWEITEKGRKILMNSK